MAPSDIPSDLHYTVARLVGERKLVRRAGNDAMHIRFQGEGPAALCGFVRATEDDPERFQRACRVCAMEASTAKYADDRSPRVWVTTTTVERLD